jgi:hypothetical protein
MFFLGAKERRGVKQRGPLLLFEYSKSRGYPEGRVLKKLSIAGLAKLSRLGMVWPQPAIVDSESMIDRCAQPANSQLIPQSMMKYLGLARLA